MKVMTMSDVSKLVGGLRRARALRGMSLLEIMVVITLIGLVTAGAITAFERVFRV